MGARRRAPVHPAARAPRGPAVLSDPALDLLGTWVRVLSLRTRLLAWYDRAKRDLPWRRDPTPYRVLVSEAMLQQTRVDVVVPYYERWLARWPDVEALAAADLDDVLAAWSGLGYYRRARSLHAAAQAIVAEHDGRVPGDEDALRALPGVGPYTAAAVASIAFDVPVPVVDGNVERVLTRLLCDASLPSAARKRRIEEAARRLVTGLVGDDPQALEPPDGLRAADWSQAMMELGATVCSPRDPSCDVCPWSRSCLGAKAGLAVTLPRKKPKGALRDVALHMAVVRRRRDDVDEVLLLRRPGGALLAGMWELPTSAENTGREGLAAVLLERVGPEAVAALPATPRAEFRHGITNRRITVSVYDVPLDGGETSDDLHGVAWTARGDLGRFGVSSMTTKALRSDASPS